MIYATKLRVKDRSWEVGDLKTDKRGRLNDKQCVFNFDMKGYEKRVSLLHRTATTRYRCFDQDLTEFPGSWSYRTYPLQRYNFFFYLTTPIGKTPSFYCCSAT